MSITALILAAGKGTRMKSSLPKVLHPVAGKPMVCHVVDAVRQAGIQRVAVVVGFGADQVRAVLDDVIFVHQDRQLGTGHAVIAAAGAIKDSSWVLVLPGDAPLVTAGTFAPLLARRVDDVGAVVLTAVVADPTGYGRIVRDRDGSIARIVEEADATPEQKMIKEVNTGIILFRVEPLLRALEQVRTDNSQGEYYLVDVLPLLAAAGHKIEAVTAGATDVGALVGVNDRIDLAAAEAVMRRRVLDRLMLDGVTIVDPETTFIDAGVRIGADTVIEPFTIIRGDTEIGQRCRIGPGAEIIDSRIGDDCSIGRSVLEQSRLGNSVTVGPFCHLRAGTDLADGVKVGNFAEIKNTRVDAGSKVPHHSYLGDAVIGRGVNIGAGVVTVNYDGRKKHQTVIADGAFIGCNVNLVAPVQVGREGYVAAGSTIDMDVPERSLAIARERQSNKLGWVDRRRAAGQPDPS